MEEKIILAIVIAYLLGSIPFAYIMGRLVKGVDIRKVGGGNMGAVNTMREIGPIPGFTVLLADMAKGSLAVLVAQWLDVSLFWVFVAGGVVVAGHNWPVWLGFKGGQGLATTLGVLLALTPVEFAISFAIMVVVVLLTSNMRLGPAIGMVFLPLIIWLMGGELDFIVYAIALPVFCFLKSFTRLKADTTRISSKKGIKGLFVDREYKPWQKKR